mgnify:CR=1 FL=1
MGDNCTTYILALWLVLGAMIAALPLPVDQLDGWKGRLRPHICKIKQNGHCWENLQQEWNLKVKEMNK